MPLPIISQVLRAQLRGLCPSGQPWMITMHFHRTAAGAWTAADITAQDLMLKKVMSSNIYAGGQVVKAYMKTTSSWTDTVYTPLDGSAASTTINAGIAGTAAQDSLPSEDSVVVTLRTAKRGRSYRGRTYLPPFVVSQVDGNGFVIASAVTALAAQWGTSASAGWVNDMITNGPGTLHVASYLHATSEPVTAGTVDNKFDVQRRRK